jgi:signal transduction histidine kinase
VPRLAQFIREHREEILNAWEGFARKLPASHGLDINALRDHAGAMLDAVARDLETPQSEAERTDKAQQVPDPAPYAEASAASQHGLGRAEQGYDVESMLAEFRALRASVIALWRERQNHAAEAQLEELTRFNEAIDQAIAESVAHYMQEVETARDRFLAVLGHDLRTPLGVVVTSSQLLREMGSQDPSQQTIISAIERSGSRMIELVRDLLDLAITRLGSGIPIKPAEMDLAALVREVVAETTGANPTIRIDVQCSGALEGDWR